MPRDRVPPSAAATATATPTSTKRRKPHSAHTSDRAVRQATGSVATAEPQGDDVPMADVDAREQQHQPPAAPSAPTRVGVPPEPAVSPEYEVLRSASTSRNQDDKGDDNPDGRDATVDAEEEKEEEEVVADADDAEEVEPEVEQPEEEEERDTEDVVVEAPDDDGDNDGAEEEEMEAEAEEPHTEDPAVSPPSSPDIGDPSMPLVCATSDPQRDTNDHSAPAEVAEQPTARSKAAVARIHALFETEEADLSAPFNPTQQQPAPLASGTDDNDDAGQQEEEEEEDEQQPDRTASPTTVTFETIGEPEIRAIVKYNNSLASYFGMPPFCAFLSRPVLRQHYVASRDTVPDIRTVLRENPGISEHDLATKMIRGALAAAKQAVDAIQNKVLTEHERTHCTLRTADHDARVVALDGFFSITYWIRYWATAQHPSARITPEQAVTRVTAAAYLIPSDPVMLCAAECEYAAVVMMNELDQQQQQ